MIPETRDLSKSTGSKRARNSVHRSRGVDIKMLAPYFLVLTFR